MNILKKYVIFFGILLSLLIPLYFVLNANKTISIEEHNWKFKLVQDANSGTVYACADEYISIYPDVMNLDITCEVDNDILKIYHNNQTFDITYSIKSSNGESSIYNIQYKDSNGKAVSSITKNYDGTQIPTLILQLDGYVLYFEDK